MPHRATYIFPRQFPGNGGFPQPQPQPQPPCGSAADHEKKKKKVDLRKSGFNKNVIGGIGNDEEELLVKKFTGDCELKISNYSTQKKKLATFYNWFGADVHNNKKKAAIDEVIKPAKLSYDESELLLPPEPEAVPEPTPVIGGQVSGDRSPSPATVAKDSGFFRQRSLSSSLDSETVSRKDSGLGFDRQVSLPRLSSCGSSYGAGSFFSSEIQEIQSTVQSSVMARTHEMEDEEVFSQDNRKEKEAENRKSLAEKARQSYYLQITLARRLSSGANLGIGNEPRMLLFESGVEGHGLSSDAEAVSYRLWVLFLHSSLQLSSC